MDRASTQILIYLQLLITLNNILCDPKDGCCGKKTETSVKDVDGKLWYVIIDLSIILLVTQTRFSQN